MLWVLEAGSGGGCVCVCVSGGCVWVGVWVWLWCVCVCVCGSGVCVCVCVCSTHSHQQECPDGRGAPCTGPGQGRLRKPPWSGTAQDCLTPAGLEKPAGGGAGRQRALPVSSECSQHLESTLWCVSLDPVSLLLAQTFCECKLEAEFN